MAIQSSPDSKSIEVCSFTLDKITRRNCELQTINELERQKNLVYEQTIKILEAKNTGLEDKCTKFESEKTEKEILIQLIDENLQSSKRVLQYTYAIAGAILGGSAVLVCPPIGAAVALSGTVSAVVASGAALAGGAAGGCLVAPVIHEKTNNALIQQVQTFKTNQEVSKKVEQSKIQTNNIRK